LEARVPEFDERLFDNMAANYYAAMKKTLAELADVQKRV
jgi:hypothetical protein